MDFWKRLISRRATVPGRKRWGFLTPPAAAVFLTAALWAMCFHWAWPAMATDWTREELETACRYYVGRSVGSQLRGTHVVDVKGRGAAQPRTDGATPFEWLRRANDEPDRAARRALAVQTRQATEARGYIFEGVRTVPLKHVSECIASTRIISPTCGEWPAGAGRGAELAPMPEWTASTELIVTRSVVFEEAVSRIRDHGKSVVAVNAASGYHCGGGFLPGGRHALEEAMCMESTLFLSLQQAEASVGEGGFPVVPWAAPSRRRDGSEWHLHIPDDGVILSPNVEHFRSGSDKGYAFEDVVVRLAAVVSVAMPNCNASVSDSPVDCNPDSHGYAAQLEQKWRAVLAAAAYYTNANCLVVPDAGCGVFRNPPAHVGHAFGAVLRREFQGRFETVVIAFPGGPAGEEFANNACAAFAGRDSVLPPPPTVSDPPLRPAAGLVPVRGAIVWEFSVSRGFEPFDTEASTLAEKAYQLYKAAGGEPIAFVPSRGKVIVLNFVDMTQHIQGFDGRTRTLRRRAC